MLQVGQELEFDIIGSLVNAFDNAQSHHYPFSHWELSQVLPQDLIEKILTIRLEKPADFQYDGTRASDSQFRNDGSYYKRMFLSSDVLNQYPFFKPLLNSFLDSAVLAKVKNVFGVDASSLFLRVEYINDFNGFFLDPHMDIPEKRFTLFLYLNKALEHLGTDLYDKNKQRVKTIRFAPNRGYVFLPGDDTWHGLEPKEIPDRRCSLLINYVTFDTGWPVSSGKI